MEYVGIQTQIRRNNIRSFILLLCFPLLLAALAWVIVLLVRFKTADEYAPFSVEHANADFLSILPFLFSGVFIWFLIAFFFHKRMIMQATRSAPLERMAHKRVYNLVENLCISEGMASIPSIYIIEDASLNAFASGIYTGSYAISLSRGIIEKLNDEELQAVIAHELTHIRNRDTRLLIVSIIFVGIFSFVAELILRNGGIGSRRSDKSGSGGVWFLVALALAGLAYMISLIIRFAISRKREYMADAGAVELTKNPEALANALRKIAEDPRIEAVERKDLAQLFIENPQGELSWLQKLFSTHPPIVDRISYLEQL